jgi:hypothetical protein
MGACSKHGKDEKYMRNFGRKFQKRPLGRRRRRWEDNITMDLIKTRREVVDWIHLSQDREQRQAFVNTVTILRV